MRARVVVGVVAAAVIGLAGCTGGGPPATPAAENTAVDTSQLSGEISFQTWSLKNDQFTPYFEKLIADFEAENPGTTINWIDQPGEGYEDKVLQQANSNSLPDVVNLPDGFAKQLNAAGKLVDLKAAAPNAVATYVDGGVAAYTFDDKLTGYPWYLGTDVNWWNTKQLGEAKVEVPTSLDEWFTTAEKAAKDTGGKVKLFSGLPGPEELVADGASIYDPATKKFLFNSPEAVQQLDRYAALFKAGAMPPEALNNDYAGNSTMYAQGKVGYTTSTSSYVRNVLEKDAPGLIKDTEVTERFTTPPLYVQGISVAADSKNPALALAFAQYVTNDANQVEFVKLAVGFLPGTKAGNSDTAALTADIDEPLLKQAVELAAAQMPKAKLLKPPEFTDDMNTYTKQQVALVMQGKLGAQEALDKAVKYCEDNLAE